MSISAIKGGKVKGRMGMGMVRRLGVWHLKVEDVACVVGDKVILQCKVRRGGGSWVGEQRMLEKHRWIARPCCRLD